MTAPREFLSGRVTVFSGDCLDVLAGMDECSVDSVVCDPPYHLTSIVKRFGAEGAAEAKSGATGAFKRASSGFMGKQWDGGDIAFRPDTWRAVLRVLKPGGYILAFASTRGFGRMSVGIEDAGFVTHPLVAWIFGSGFPKATRIKAQGYDGFRYGGQALKPAIEPIYMGQKPFSEVNGTANVLRWGVGALNIDGCRVEAVDKTPAPVGVFVGSTIGPSGHTGARDGRADHLGRWPANVIHDGSEEVLAAFPESGGQQGDVRGTEPSRTGDENTVAYGEFGRVPFGKRGDSGSAARFFKATPFSEDDLAWGTRLHYTAKADAHDRLGSRHPTVKPLDLMQYLVRLVTPPGGLVLDPFAGTGTTGEAAFREGMRAILIEREEEYQADIARRMELAEQPTKRAAVAKAKGALMGAEDTPLFSGDAA